MFTKITKTAKSISNVFDCKNKKKRKVDPTLRCKFGFYNLPISEIMKTFHGDPEIWTTEFLKENPEYRYVSNSRHMLDHFDRMDEYFKSKTTDQIADQLKTGFKELFEHVKNDPILWENFLNSKHKNTKNGTLKFIACLLYTFQMDGVDVVRVPRDHHGFNGIGFDDTAVLLSLSYLVSKNIIFTTVGQKFTDKLNNPGYFDGKTGYVPSFAMFTLSGIKMMKKLAKQARKEKKKFKIGKILFNQYDSDYIPVKQTMKWRLGDRETRKAMEAGMSLWVTDQEALYMASKLGIIYNDQQSLVNFLNMCKIFIENCGYLYDRSIRAISYHFREYLDQTNSRIWVEEGGLARFIKYIMFGQSEFCQVKTFNFYMIQ